MPRRFKVDLDPANSSTDRYASGATGATFTLTNTTSGDGLARQILITNNDAVDHTGKTVAGS